MCLLDNLRHHLLHVCISMKGKGELHCGAVIISVVCNTVVCRVKECGEDLLVDVSEVLFRELAFFKLIKRPLR